MPKPDLSGWQTWGLTEAPILIKLFSLGKNHQTSLIESANKKYVLKHFNHSFDQALSGQELGQSLQLSPQIYYAGNKLLLTDYVDRSLPSLRHTAQALSVLHAFSDWDKVSKKFEQNPTSNILANCDQYAENAPQELQVLHQKWRPLLKEFDQDTTPHCFCHNDLVKENCLSKNSQALFIDWEFSGLNNPWFDLASIIVYRELNSVQTSEFLNHYSGWQDKTQQRIFTISQITVIWCDILWHTNKLGSSYIPPDHISIQKIKELVNNL